MGTVTQVGPWYHVQLHSANSADPITAGGVLMGETIGWAQPTAQGAAKLNALGDHPFCIWLPTCSNIPSHRQLRHRFPCGFESDGHAQLVMKDPPSYPVHLCNFRFLHITSEFLLHYSLSSLSVCFAANTNLFKFITYIRRSR